MERGGADGARGSRLAALLTGYINVIFETTVRNNIIYLLNIHITQIKANRKNNMKRVAL